MTSVIVRRLLPVCLIALVVLPAIVSAAEIGATHLVYDKKVKMKKVEVTLFLPYFDQSRKSDSLLRARTLDCLVVARGKSGPLPVTGKILLEIVGRRGSARWQSQTASSAVDNGGTVFGSSTILDLANQAATAGADPELFRIRFDGGRGKKVTSVTLDCLHEEGPP